MPYQPFHAAVVSYNHVHQVDGIMGDGGSIYTLGPQGNRRDTNAHNNTVDNVLSVCTYSPQ